MRTIRRSATLLGLATIFSAGLLAAQGKGSISIHAYGGGVHNLGKISGLGVYDTKFGTGFGGGIGYQVSDVFTLRADGYLTKSTITMFDVEQADKMDRRYVSLIAKLQLPNGSIRPYFLVGAGGTFIDQHTTVEPKPSFVHYLGGAGVEFPLGGNGLSFFAETRVAMYNATSLIGNPTGATRFMADAALTGGLSYRIK